MARLDGRIVAFLALVGDELDQLYLFPGLYRRGIGSRLLEKAKELCPDRLSLFTFRRNGRARVFHEARGFRVVDAGGGSGNEEGEPDIRYEWSPASGAAATAGCGLDPD